jgi:hypothetical protein
MVSLETKGYKAAQEIAEKYGGVFNGFRYDERVGDVVGQVSVSKNDVDTIRKDFPGKVIGRHKDIIMPGSDPNW